MRFYSFVIVFLLLFASIANAGPFAKEANENPFLNGELNPKYEGEVTALAGEVIEIQPTKQNYPVYKLNLRIKGIKNIWATSIAPEPKGGIKLGDMIICERPPAKSRWLLVTAKSRSFRLKAIYSTLKSSSGSFGFWFSIYAFHTSSVTFPLEATQYPLAHKC